MVSPNHRSDSRQGVAGASLLALLAGLLMFAAVAHAADLTNADQPAAANPTVVVAAAAPGAVVPAPAEVLIFLQPGTDANAYALLHGLTITYEMRSDPDAFVFAAGSADAAAQLLASAETDPSVRAAYPNEPAQHVKYAFVPNDPYFHKNTPSSGWRGQWHLINEYVSGRDVRVQDAWNRDITGSGVIIGIVDDCLETAHPDLAPNYVAADSWDFGQNDADPNPVYSSDEHGVSTSGVAAARGGNGIGVTGAAPFAGLAGLREDFTAGTTAEFADGTMYHSSGFNTNIKVKNHSYGVNAPYILSSSEKAALATSAAAGTIHCFAAGNERGSIIEDANKTDLQNSPDAITVAAMGSGGTVADYSSFGANVFVTAPSNSSSGYGVTTTDRTTEARGYNGSSDSFPDGNYTSIFGGTSSASPLVAGVMALGKQAQPNLNVRFAKHILVRTSDVIDANDATETGGGNGTTAGSAWKTNAAGFKFNENYGFGLIDADGFTQLAAQYQGVTPLTTAATGTVSVAASIPDNNITGISRTFTITPANPQPLEEVQVTLNISHTSRGQVEALLTSPAGTVSRLMLRASSDTGDNINWTFLTNAFWGEAPSGQWTLNVRDRVSGTTGTWNSYTVNLRMGTLVTNATIPAAPSDPGLALLATSTTQIRWTWVDNSTDEWGFKVYADPGAGPPTTLRATTAADVKLYDYAGLSANTQHCFQVAATNLAGDSSKTANFARYTFQIPVTTPTFANLASTSFRAVTTGAVNLTSGDSGVVFNVQDVDRAKVTQLLEDMTGLTPNVSYNVKAKGLNGDGVATGYSATSTKTTLARPGIDTDGLGNNGNVFCTNAVVNAVYGPGQTFAFANPAGFGASTHGGNPWKASSLQYKWNQSATEIWVTNGTTWNSGTLNLTPAPGDNYLHVRAFNSDGVANNVELVNYGPFKFDAAPGAPTDAQASAPSFCSGGSAVLTAVPGSGGDTVQWYSGSCGGTLVPGGAAPTVSPATGAIYYARTLNTTTGDTSATCAQVAINVCACVPSDFDQDCDVDLNDFVAFAGCISGPTVPYAAGCASKDLDHDNDVDVADFGAFQRCFSGPGQPVNPNCGG